MHLVLYHLQRDNICCACYNQLYLYAIRGQIHTREILLNYEFSTIFAMLQALYLQYVLQSPFFRPNYDVKFPGNLPALFRRISKSDINEPALPVLRELLFIAPHPPVSLCFILVFCIHP